MGVSKRLRSCTIFQDNLHSVVGMDVFFNNLDLYRINGQAKFDESIDVCFKIGSDPKKSDQVIKTSCTLPNGSGKSVSIAVFSSSVNNESFIKAGAKYAGGDDLIEKIFAKEIVPGRDFSLCLASPDMMVKLGKIARILGPKGIMPNAKLGTVSENLLVSVEDAMKGRAELRTDKLGYIRLSIGRISFDNNKIKGNLLSVYEALKLAKPVSIKGTYLVGLKISSTMMGRSFSVKMSDIYNA
jgi:large subunit ribosomal protein L1